MSGQPTADELVARARALVPALRQRQARAEADRRVPQESIEEITDAGLYKTLQPRRYGGYEYGLEVFVDIAAAIASGCGSTGWVFTTSAQHQWLIGMFPDQAQADVWGSDPRAVSASSFGPTGVAVETDRGFRLTGKWLYCSGVDNTGWMILGVRIASAPGAEPGAMGYLLVPKSDFTIEDNWHVIGLAGTGSKNVICDDVLVPAHRLLRLDDALSGRPPGAAVNTGELFSIPFFAAISICLGGAIMGMAEGAFEEFVAATRQRITRGAALSKPVAMAAIPTVQLRVGEAASSIEAARLLVDRDCKDIMATVATGRTLTVEQRARNKGDLGFATQLSLRAVDRLFEAGGAAGLFTDGRMQRHWRDIHAGAMHISMNWDAVGALYGRVTLGLPAGTAQF